MNSIAIIKAKKIILKYFNLRQLYFILFSILYLIINGFLYTISYQEIHLLWTTAGDQDFGYVLLAIAIFYGYKRSRDITLIQPFFWLALPFLALSIIHYIGQLYDVKTFRLLTLVIGWPFFLGLILGKSFFKNLLLPTALIVMALPAWYLLIPLLQSMTVFGITLALSFINIPIFIESNFIHIPNGIIHVAGGCSGLKYLQTAIALSIIMALLQSHELKKIIITVIFATFLAIISNWIRVFILILVGHFSGLDHPLMTDHDNLGWVIFLIALIPLIVIDRKLLNKENKKEGILDKEKMELPLNKSENQTLKITSIFIACGCITLPYFMLNLFC